MTNIGNYKVSYKDTHKDDANIKTVLLLGQTGSGKSTLVEKLCPLLKGLSSNNYKSFTSRPMAFNILKDQLRIIDTPGMNDTEGRSQDMFDNMYRSLRYYNTIDCVIILYQWTPRLFNTGTSDAIDKYIEFLNVRNKCVILCIVGRVGYGNDDLEYKSSVTKAVQEHLIDDNICLSDIVHIMYWDEANPNTKDKDFNNLITKMHEICNNNLVYIDTTAIREVITKEAYIEMLKNDITRLSNRNNKRDGTIVHVKKVLDEALKSNKTTYLRNQVQCIGLTRYNTRCIYGRLSCSYLKNYYTNDIPRHHSVIPGFEKDDVTVTITKDNYEKMMDLLSNLTITIDDNEAFPPIEIDKAIDVFTLISTDEQELVDGMFVFNVRNT